MILWNDKLTKMKERIKQEFEAGNFHMSLIASRLGTSRGSVKSTILRDAKLSAEYKHQADVKRAAQAAERNAVAEYAAEHGAVAAMVHFKKTRGTVYGAIYAQRNSKQMASEARQEKAQSSFVQWFWY
jgi:ParB-like chromosome segregation protein Spo0J